MPAHTDKPVNRLAKETSPYLLQHQHNPVDWYPWGEEAFARARSENKPIFLSVGYSTCYWCHVMERECFENDEIAALMNRDFVCIKVDREERPDVDQLYMTATQVLTRQGGWPMSVWMTPDLKPFYAGTYFPPRDAYNRPGFPSLLTALAEAWRERRVEIERHADSLVDAIRQSSELKSDEGLHLKTATIRSLIKSSLSDYEPRFGGFGDAPKFPRQTLLSLLLDAHILQTEDQELRDQIEQTLTHTLSAMASGGIRDHLGGGFHRYSTDERWLVPHFEIMLYDQAMLAPIYARAATRFGNIRFARVARGICDFVLREMRSPEGAFFTAFDAEVDGREGQNYLWTAQQVIDVLGPEAGGKFNALYGLSNGPNFADPHHSRGVAETNVLFFNGTDEQEVDYQLGSMRAALLDARRSRRQPALDTKIITSWNALMIAGLAIVARELKEPSYRDAAERAADFLLKHHRDEHRLARSSRDGKCQPGDAFLDDYAALSVALLELTATTRDVRWQLEAESVAKQMLERFGDESGALYFTARGQHDILVRQQVGSDSPLPAGNALAVQALSELGQTERAESIVNAYADSLTRYPHSMSALLRAAMLLNNPAFDVRADVGPQIALPSTNDVVTLSGERVSDRELRLRAQIRDGYHLYESEVDPALGLHATRVLIEPALAKHVEEIRFPEPKPLDLPYGPPIRGFEGDVQVRIRFSVPMKSEAVTLSLSFQACDDRACLRPSVLSISV